MNCEISKELLSEVLKENIVEVYKIGSNPNFERNTLLYKLYRCGDICSVNIYELVHKCKEWALKQGYYITSDLIEVNIHPIEYGAVKMKSILCIDIVDNINEWELNEHHLASSEQQAVFDACQWILDNKDKQ